MQSVTISLPAYLLEQLNQQAIAKDTSLDLLIECLILESGQGNYAFGDIAEGEAA